MFSNLNLKYIFNSSNNNPSNIDMNNESTFIDNFLEFFL
jgi:hypothetical protein